MKAHPRKQAHAPELALPVLGYDNDEGPGRPAGAFVVRCSRACGKPSIAAAIA